MTRVSQNDPQGYSQDVYTNTKGYKSLYKIQSVRVYSWFD